MSGFFVNARNLIAQAVAVLTASFSASGGAALIGFIQSGTGSVATTAQAKIRERVSVFDKMSAAQIADAQAGTYAYDMTTAFTNAQGAGNVDVIIPPGYYLLNNLRIKSGVRLLGAGYEATILKQGAAGNYAIACTSDVDTGQLSSVELSAFKVVGATSATVAAVIVNAAGVYAVWKSKFDFVAADTYRALEVQASAANNVFRCDFKITSQDTSDTAVVINGGTYNNFDLFLTNCMSGRALNFVGLACTFTRSISDGQQYFAGNETVANSVTVEEWSGTALASEAAIESQGFNELFINPMVILTAPSTGKVGAAFRPFDGTVYVNPKALASVLANPFLADNSYKFTIIGPGQCTTTNKMNTVFTDGGGNANLSLRRVEFVGNCSQWVTSNRPGGGATIQYSAPLTGATVEYLSNTDVLIVDPAGALAALTIQIPLATDGQTVTISPTQSVTTMTWDAGYTGGADVSLFPTTLTGAAPQRFIYRSTSNKWFRR